MLDNAPRGHTILQVGAVQVNFYVREPSPNQWNAIGVVSFDDEAFGVPPSDTTCRMIVGSGPSRDEAIGDLITRVLSGQHPALRHADMALPRTGLPKPAVQH